MIVCQQKRIKAHWEPCGKRETLQDYYMVRQAEASYADYWGTVTDPDGKVRHRDSEIERLRFVEDTKYLIDFVNDLHPQSVVDFGAGLGWLLDELHAEYKAAVEIAPQAIERLNHKDIPVYEDIADIISDSCDVLIAHHVLEHLTDPLYVVNHFHRVLCKHGWLIVGTPDFGSPCAKRFGDKYRMLHDPTHCSLFTLESCIRMLRDHGFIVRNVEFPFPQRYATPENLYRWMDRSKVSPPWPGNWFTVLVQRA